MMHCSPPGMETGVQGQPSGIVIIDKPAGVSSAKVVADVKRTLKVDKVGHTGTLDPFATGVMACCINRATKLARFFLGGAKRYEAILTLGVETDTQDVTGQVTATGSCQGVDRAGLDAAVRKFVGHIDQLPPAYSALKHEGVPLYRLARKGRPVQKPPRRVHVTALEVRAVELPDVHVSVACSAGTYVRTLAADIGAALGCGGHLKALRRTESAGFGLEQALTLSELKSLADAGRPFERMIAMADALPEMPQVVADNRLAADIRHGRPVTPAQMPLDPNAQMAYIKVVDRRHRLLAVLGHNETNRTFSYECVVCA